MKISETKEIVVPREESGFDRACDSANYQAHSTFGIDDDGHSSRLPDWERSACWIEIDFVGYKKIGGHHIYTFNATAMRSDDFEEDE